MERNTCVLSCVFPGVREYNSTPLQGRRHTQAALATALMLNEKVSIPGSLALTDPIVRRLVMESLPYLQAGIFCIDLRSSCQSFSDLIKEKKILDPLAEEAARSLDKNKIAPIYFEAGSTSEIFRNRLLEFLSNISEEEYFRKADIVKIENVASYLRNEPGILSLAKLMERTPGKRSAVDRRIAAAIHYFYSTIGAEVSKADAQIPFSLWSAAINGKRADGPEFDDRTQAHSSVMTLLQLQPAALLELSQKDLIKLRREGLVHQIRAIIDDAISESEKLPVMQSDRDDEAAVVDPKKIAAIESYLQQRLRNERNSVPAKLSRFFDLISKIDTGIPTQNLWRPAAIKLGRFLSRQARPLKYLDYVPFTPLLEYGKRISGK